MDELQWGGHAGVSAVTLAGLGLDRSLQQVVGQHHGFKPQIAHYPATAEYFGGDAWHQERCAVLQALKDTFQMDLPSKLSETQVIAVSGLTSVADWIGSGPLFNDPSQTWEPRIAQAVHQAGYTAFKLKQHLTFSDIFGFDARPIQTKFIQATQQQGVYVLEAPMGIGKTEAALYAAYQMLDQAQATGIYFALPTQLTSNKIYDRFNHFLIQILEEDCVHRKALLLHGAAWQQTAQMGEEGLPGRSWFHAAKRGLLAPFAVGTLIKR